MGTLALDDVTLHYEVHGEGTPLFLLHGFFGAGVDFAPFLSRFGRDRRLVVPDLRGHGRSTLPPGRFTFRDCARDVLALADALGLERFGAVGLSGGGNTLLHVATMQPARVEAMVLVSATTHYPDPARAIQRHFRHELFDDDEQARMRVRHPGGDAQVAALVGYARAFADDHDDLAFSAEMLRAVTAPTLIVYGDRDPFYPVEIAVSMLRALPRAALWVVPGGGHTPIGPPHTDAFVRLVVDFFADPARPLSAMLRA